jgi:hypothetical protein
VRPLVLLLLLSAVAGGRAAADSELWSGGGFRLGFSGSLREIATWTKGTDSGRFLERLDPFSPRFDPACASVATFPDCGAFQLVNERDVLQSLTRLRTDFSLRAPAGFSAQLVYDHEALAAVPATLEGGFSRGLAQDALLGADARILQRDHVEWRHRLYRATLQFSSEHAEVVLGRQRVAWGVGRLWNPIDRFNPIPPLAIEADQSPGVDAALLRWVIDGFDYLEAVYAPGTGLDDDPSAALRFHGILFDADFSPTAGFDLERHLGDAAVHLEVVWTDPRHAVWPLGAARPEPPPDYWQVVGSVDWNLDWGNGIYLVLEHFYNGNALGFGRGRAGVLLPFFEQTSAPPFLTAASRDVLGASPLLSFSEQQTGLQASSELTPGIDGSLLPQRQVLPHRLARAHPGPPGGRGPAALAVRERAGAGLPARRVVLLSAPTMLVRIAGGSPAPGGPR